MTSSPHGSWDNRYRALQLVEETQIIPGLLVDSSLRNVGLARGFAYECLRREDWKWVDRQRLANWLPDQVVCLATLLRPQMKTWEFVERHGDATNRAYWDTISVALRDTGAIWICRYAATMLLKHNRPFAAATVLSIAIERKVLVDSDQVALVLPRSRTPKSSTHPRLIGHLSYGTSWKR